MAAAPWRGIQHSSLTTRHGSFMSPTAGAEPKTAAAVSAQRRWRVRASTAEVRGSPEQSEPSGGQSA
eukprot:3311681-Alexandrium_andersonii.AAC.1